MLQSEGQTPLHIAVSNEDETMVAFLVSRSAKTDIADSVSWCISLMIFTHFFFFDTYDLLEDR